MPLSADLHVKQPDQWTTPIGDVPCTICWTRTEWSVILAGSYWCSLSKVAQNLRDFKIQICTMHSFAREKRLVSEEALREGVKKMTLLVVFYY